MKIGFAIIGTGTIANVYAKIILKNKNAKLLAVRSEDKIRAEEFAKKYRIKAYTNYEELLKNEEINAVIIATKNNTHAELGIKAAKAKKHVLVEKPIDIKLEKVDQLINECKKNEVKLSVISQKRFDDKLLKLKKDIHNGEFGKLSLVNLSLKWHRTKHYYDSSLGWRKKQEFSGGGVLIMQAIHYIDILLWLLGKPEKIYGTIQNSIHETECEDTAVAILKYKNGTIATIEATTSATKTLPERIEIQGEKKSIVYTPHFIDKIKNRKQIDRQLEDFILSIINNKEPLITGIAGKEALELILKIYESAKLKKEINGFN